MQPSRLSSITSCVSQRTRRVEHYGRNADGSWRYTVVTGQGSVELVSGGVLSLEELYLGAFEVAGDEGDTDAGAR